MATGSTLGEQLAGMMNAIKYYSDSRSPTQSSDLSFMTLIWPLLPLMPPEPPKSIIELLKEPQRCDVCGVAEKRPLLKCTKSNAGGQLKPLLTDDTLRSNVSDKKTPLEKLMRDIEEKINETINSIETTTKHTVELKKQTKNKTIGKNDLTDDEILKRLNSLVNKKAVHERRVKALETKEKELKESLMMAIEWAKGIETKGREQPNISVDNAGTSENTDVINQSIEHKT